MVVTIVLVVITFLAGPGDSGVALDPRSAAPTGTAGLADVLRELGVDVAIGTDLPGGDATVLLLVDDLGSEEREELHGWVRSGGHLVITDPFSPLAGVAVSGPPTTSPFGAPVSHAPRCPLLDGFVRGVESARWLILEAPPGATTCFPFDGGGAGLVVREEGVGQVVVTSVVDALVNERLAAADNGRFAVAMLTIDDERDITVRWGRVPGGGETPLLSLVPRPFWMLVAALSVAGALVALNRGRRVGLPVPERLPVRVPGSELALAVGDLLGRHGHRAEVAGRLRADVHRDLASALGVPADTTGPVLAAILVETGMLELDPDDLTAVTADISIDGDDQLLALGRSVARVRKAMRQVTGPPVE